MNKQNSNQKTRLPQIFKPYLWSYDFKRLDKKHDQKLIITQVLNFGTKEATDKLFSIYTKEEIIEILKHPLPGMWNKKSLNYWSFVFNVRPPTKLIREIAL